MKVNSKKMMNALLCLFLQSCSSIDSLQVFDEQQAQQLVAAMYAKPSHQNIKITLPKHFKYINTHDAQNNISAIVIPRSQNIYDWQESFQTSLIPYAKNKKLTSRLYLIQRIKQIKKICEQYKLQILSENKNELLYKFILKDCQNFRDQIQIGKIFIGSDGLYIVQYVALTDKISKQGINMGLHAIAAAQLVN